MAPNEAISPGPSGAFSRWRERISPRGRGGTRSPAKPIGGRAATPGKRMPARPRAVVADA